jgi:FkbH-like protein
MVVQIAPATDATLPRIAQLTNKTNQFNVTTRRYSEADLMSMQANGFDVFSMHVSDRFGDNGLVGVAILGPVEDQTVEIDTLLLSCRVMGRQVEAALLDYLVDTARDSGGRVLRGVVINTAKNEPARDCYERHGFKQVNQVEAKSVWELELADYACRAPAWLSVHSKQPATRMGG